MIEQQNLDCEGIVDEPNPIYISKDLSENYDYVEPQEIEEKHPFFHKFFWWVRNRVACFKRKDDKDTYLILIYTENHEYSIVVRPNYIGGGVSCRYQYPLEDWTRGNDLVDGQCTKSVLDSLVYNMLAYELVDITDKTSILKNNEVK